MNRQNGNGDSTTKAVTSQEVRRRLQARGLSLPTPWQIPEGVEIPATLVRVLGSRVFVSGHVPIDEGGSICGPSGKVGDGVDLVAAQRAAEQAMLGAIASVERAIGDLGRIRGWCRLYCMVDAAESFADLPAVFNPSSQLLVDAFGDEVGAHSRVAVGVAGLPWNMPVEIEAELELHPA